MRDIKFKAYNKRDVETTHFSFTNNIVCMHDKDDLHICSDKGGWDFYDSDLIIMQYIGLKDKNGVEIYEDDNLKIILDSGTYISPVMKRHGCWVIYHPYRLDMHTGDKDYINFGWWTSHDNVEVVGNIHEKESHT